MGKPEIQNGGNQNERDKKKGNGVVHSLSFGEEHEWVKKLRKTPLLQRKRGDCLLGRKRDIIREKRSVTLK